MLDFGCGSTLFGPAFRAIGARSYTGVDKSIDLNRKRMRSRTLKQTVGTDISLAYAVQAVPNISYMQGDDIISRNAFDVVLMSSVTYTLPNMEQILANAARALRSGGQIWVLHDNFHAWAGHLQHPKGPASYDPADPEHRQYADWAHVTFDAPEDHPFRGLSRLRLADVRALFDRHFEVHDWKEIRDKSTLASRLTSEVRQRLKGFSDSELLTKQVIIRGRKR